MNESTEVRNRKSSREVGCARARAIELIEQLRQRHSLAHSQLQYGGEIGPSACAREALCDALKTLQQFLGGGR